MFIFTIYQEISNFIYYGMKFQQAKCEKSD
jgi:hypothetical protein